MARKKGKILIVDDNEEILIACKLFLRNHFIEVITESNPVRIPEHLGQNIFDVILLDMNFKAGISTGNEGIYWMRQILERDSNAVIVFMTAYADIELAVKAIREGAADFIEKPWDDEKLLATILSAYRLRQSKLEIRSLRDKQNYLSETLNQDYNLVIGKSPAMQRVMETVDKVAKTDANVLILGENGTGKELIAREIHRRSMRTGEVFINVDLGAITETLFESELFGHVKGAFTDAREDRAGRFEIASKGTLFLDEIGNLSLPLQAKLLTVLQNRLVTRVGSNQQIPVDVRLISATNLPVFDMVSENRFREDLLYRINTIQIELPPLRQRREDIPELAAFFLQRYEKKYCKSGLTISASGIQKLQQHRWNGNIRELQHAIEKAIILSSDTVLRPEDFFFTPSHKTSLPVDDNLNLEYHEKVLIQKAINKNEGNLSKAVQELGISRKTLYNKLKKYGL